MNQVRNTIIYNFLLEISQKMATYPAQMTGLKTFEMMFMKTRKADDPNDELSCISGTTLRS